MAAGRPVVVVDDEDRENEGDLIFAAASVTPEMVGFMVRHTSGVICVPMEATALDRLHLPPMTAINEDRKNTAYSVSVDARDGVSTGISAADRARTITLLASPATQATELTRPGHVFPLRAVEGGVLRRAGHTEASVDLARLAGLEPAGVLCELVHDDGSMMRAPALPRLRRRARPADDLDRRPHRLPPAQREPRAARGGDRAADPPRPVPRRRLSHAHRQQRARRPRPR